MILLNAVFLRINLPALLTLSIGVKMACGIGAKLRTERKVNRIGRVPWVPNMCLKVLFTEVSIVKGMRCS